MKSRPKDHAIMSWLNVPIFAGKRQLAIAVFRLGKQYLIHVDSSSLKAVN